MNLTKTFSALLVSGLLATAMNSQAATISCGDAYRTASAGSASACYAESLGSTAKTGDVNTATGGSWSLLSGLTASGTDGWFDVTGTGWGSGSASGTWTIASAFWNNFTSALITMHVGGGQKGADDNFEWLITPQTLAGNWSYSLLAGKGGGLSNIKLWGMGPKPEPLPPPVAEVLEPGSLSLMLLGALGIILIRRRNAR